MRLASGQAAWAPTDLQPLAEQLLSMQMAEPVAHAAVQLAEAELL